MKYQQAAYALWYDRAFRTFAVRTLRSRLVAWHEKRLVRKALAAAVPSPRRIADIPCGTGKLSGVLAGTNASVIGGDISRFMMEVARKHYAEAKSAGLVQLDLAACPFTASAFDCVVALRLMHRVPPDRRRGMLSEIARISRAHVVISYGVTGRGERLRDRLRAAFVDAGSYRRLAVGAPELAEELAASGLRVVRSSRVLWGLSREVIVLAKTVAPRLEDARRQCAASRAS